MKNILLILFLSVGFNALVKAQTLDGYKELAAKNNPSLQASYKNVEVALQKVAQVSNLPDPNLSLGYFITPVETRVGPQKIKLSLSEMFPWFGTLKAKKQEAALLADAHYQLFLNAQDKLYFKVASAFYPIVELEQLIVLESENIQILNSYKEIAQVKFQNGKGSLVDVLRAQMMLEDAQTNLEILEEKKVPLNAVLNALLNRPLNEPISVDANNFNSTIAPTLGEKDSVGANPLLEAAALKVKAAKENETIATKQGLPKLGLGVDYVFIGERVDLSMADNGKNVFMPMLSMSLPVFRAKHNAAKKTAQLRTEAFVLEKTALKNNLEASLEMELFRINQQSDLITLYQNQIQTTEQSLRLLYTSYGNSGSGFEEVLRMQQQKLKYEKLKISTTSQYWLSVEKMEYLTSNNTSKPKK